MSHPAEPVSEARPEPIVEAPEAPASSPHVVPAEAFAVLDELVYDDEETIPNRSPLDLAPLLVEPQA